MTRRIAVRAPARIDFGGGWTDVPPYSDEVGGFVCSVAISRYSLVRIRPSQDGTGEGGTPTAILATDRTLVDAARRHMGVTNVEIELSHDFPIGAGLGGSSAAGVAIVSALAAWREIELDSSEAAETSHAIETRDLGIAGGRQDHYAAAYGGVLALRFGASVEVSQVPLDVTARDELARRCIVIYTGQSRISGDTIRAVMDSYRRGDRAVIIALQRMREIAEQMPDSLRASDFETLGAQVAEQWAHQRSLHPSIPTARIDAIIEQGRRAGAVGAKALGASGGGCVLVIAGHDRVRQVREAIAPLGDLLDYGVDTKGVSRCD